MASARRPDDVRQELEAARADTMRRIVGVSADIDGIIAASTSVSTDDEHDPEGATIAFERAQLLALRAQGEKHLAELDKALERLDDGSYRNCESCGRPIGAKRLSARPFASRCINCAS
jgi:DnaK suppressor protein